VTFLGETEHFSGKNGALRWSILVGKQNHNVQKPRLQANSASVARGLMHIMAASPFRNGNRMNGYEARESSFLHVFVTILIILFLLTNKKVKLTLTDSVTICDQKNKGLCTYRA